LIAQVRSSDRCDGKGEKNMSARNDSGRSGEGVGFGVGILLGTTLGAVVAMLFAPKVGSEIRRDITEGMAELGHAAKDQWEGATAAASSAIDKGRAEYERTVRAARENAADSSWNSAEHTTGA
jgi:gas vesicle protein